MGPARSPQELDAYLDRVVIGPRQPGPIRLEAYDPAWADSFAAERKRLSVALAGLAERIEHIGSTAVEGLVAKPIIDILVTVAHPVDDSSYRMRLAPLGYELRVREERHLMFRRREGDLGFHVHFWPAGGSEEERHLGFRDRLRESAELRDEYARLKQELAPRDWPDMNHYADAKTPFIRRALSKGSAGG